MKITIKNGISVYLWNIPCVHVNYTEFFFQVFYLVFWLNNNKKVKYSLNFLLKEFSLRLYLIIETNIRNIFHENLHWLLKWATTWEQHQIKQTNQIEVNKTNRFVRSQVASIKDIGFNLLSWKIRTYKGYSSEMR